MPKTFGMFSRQSKGILYLVTPMRGDVPAKQLQLVPGAVEDAHRFLADRQETEARLERASNLVGGFESSFGLELLSTVQWVMDKEHTRSPGEVVAQTHAWNERKRRFSRRQITLAAEVLTRQSWIDNSIASNRA